MCFCGCGESVRSRRARYVRGHHCRIDPVVRFSKFAIEEGLLTRPDLGRCTEWSGGTDKDGYGYLMVHGEKTRAHRFAYEMRHGSIPSETPHILHRCDNPPCTRDEHIWAGTNLENMQDRDRKGRHGDVRGTNNPAAVLNEESVRQIRKRYEAGGISQLKLGREYGVSLGCVQNILYKNTWSFV